MRAQNGDGVFQFWTGFEWAAQFDAECAGQCFNADDSVEVFGHLQQAARTVAGHGNVVFLIGGGRCGINRCRMRHLLVFAHQCCGGYLRNHQAGIEARLFGKEGRQTKGQRWINQKCNPELGNCANFTDGKRDLVGCESNRFGMEITT